MTLWLDSHAGTLITSPCLKPGALRVPDPPILVTHQVALVNREVLLDSINLLSYNKPVTYWR
jgi:hypothetical protein